MYLVTAYHLHHNFAMSNHILTSILISRILSLVCFAYSSGGCEGGIAELGFAWAEQGIALESTSPYLVCTSYSAFIWSLL